MDIIYIMGAIAVAAVGFVAGMWFARYMRKRNDAKLEMLYDMGTDLARAAERKAREGLGGPGRPPPKPPQ